MFLDKLKHELFAKFLLLEPINEINYCFSNSTGTVLLITETQAIFDIMFDDCYTIVVIVATFAPDFG